MLDSADVDGAAKDFRKSSSKTRTRDNTRIKVSNALRLTAIPGFLENSNAQLNALSGEELQLEPLPAKSNTSLFALGQGLVVAAEVPFRILRSLNTVIMCHCQSASASASHGLVPSGKDEFDAFLDSDAASKFRKQIKQLVAELSSYTKYCVPSSPGLAVCDQPAPLSALPPLAPAAPPQTVMVQIVLFSLIDEKMDILSFDPLALKKCRWT
jgi:hypothetical protein